MRIIHGARLMNMDIFENTHTADSKTTKGN